MTRPPRDPRLKKEFPAYLTGTHPHMWCTAFKKAASCPGGGGRAGACHPRVGSGASGPSGRKRPMNSIAIRRLGVVRDTGKITKAMYLISSAKMKKAVQYAI